MTNKAPSINDRNARTASAATVFQKGIYHLFMLTCGKDSDVYALTLRTYQALFQLCLTQYLLDYSEIISKIRPALVAHCVDPKNPTAAEVDPAVAVVHAKFESGSGGWKGHPKASPLWASSLLALSLISRTTSARHSLIYRPQLLVSDNLHWEDCSTHELTANIPTPEEVLGAYRNFVKAILDHQASEIKRRSKLTRDMRNQPDEAGNLLADAEPCWADYFVQLNFWVFKAENDERPVETILSTYSRMLNPLQSSIIDELRQFRNDLFDLATIKERLHFEPEWRVGEL